MLSDRRATSTETAMSKDPLNEYRRKRNLGAPPAQDIAAAYKTQIKY